MEERKFIEPQRRDSKLSKSKPLQPIVNVKSMGD